MATKLGHGLRRRGRHGGGKRRTPRAAIAAGALAAASIPLWPSAAGANQQEYKTESRTVTVAGVSCPITMSSYRADVFVFAKIQISSDRSECTNVRWDLSVSYVAVGGQRADAAASGRGPEAVVMAVYAEDLLHSNHAVGFDAIGGWVLTLEHPNEPPKPK